MKSELKKLIYSRAIAGSFALAVTFFIWFNNFEKRIIERYYTIPCCFYNDAPSAGEMIKIVHAPDSVILCLRATRKTFRELQEDQLVVHINSAELVAGKQIVVLNEENIFLPAAVKLVEWKPTELLIVAQKTDNLIKN